MAQFLSFVLPSRSLSYVKIVQGERSTRLYDAVFELCTAEPQPILCKDSAGRERDKCSVPSVRYRSVRSPGAPSLPHFGDEFPRPKVPRNLARFPPTRGQFSRPFVGEDLTFLTSDNNLPAERLPLQGTCAKLQRTWKKLQGTCEKLSRT